MPKTRKYIQNNEYKRVQTWITDGDPSSRYFQIAELPDVLTAGKNAFLINGAPELINTTQVLVEIEDVEGNAVFLQPIEKYAEGLARVVSIEIYPETPKGVATITILGEVHRDREGNIVPDEWRNKYNVKWQRQIFIDPARQNTTKLRLYKKPELITKELLSIFRDSQQGVVAVSQSATMSCRTQPDSSQFAETDRAFFIRQMEGADLMVNTFSRKITEIVNNRVARLGPTGAVVSASLDSFLPTTNFIVSYSGSITYSSTELTRSFVEAQLTNLTTFSGEIYKVRLSVNSKESPTSFIPVGEVPLTPIELLVTESVATGEQKTPTGEFIDQTTIDTHWLAGMIGSSSYYL